MTNGPLLDPLPNGSHTLHNGKLNSDAAAEFVSRLSTQSYFKTLPRDVANTSYGTFNFLGGRLTIPNTGRFFIKVYLGFIVTLTLFRSIGLALKKNQKLPLKLLFTYCNHL